MKKQLSAFLSFCAALLFAQTIVFQHQVTENSLQTHQKLHEDLTSSYISSTYYMQPAFETGGTLDIQLLTGRRIRATLTKTFKYTNKSVSYSYAIENEPNSELVFSTFDQVITGMYASSSGEKIMFHQTAGNIIAQSLVNEPYLVARDSKDDFVADGNQAAHKVNANVCLPETPICAPSTIDVLVVYTSAARAGWGGVAQSNSQIATAITNFNNSLINSGIPNVTINLVYTGEIAYTETGNISTDLSRFRNPSDGFLDEVHNLRALYGADLCGLITATPTNTCGLGYLNTNPVNYSNNAAFSVSLRNCAVSNYTLSHEMGHNMGLNHDWYVNQSTNPCSNLHGYVNQTAVTLGTASTGAQRWRTMMAYNDQCAAAGINCPKANRWANPAVNYNGEPTGVAIGNPNPSDEAFGFARFACVVSEFMPTAAMNTVEVKTAGEKEFSIYPNPATDEINISIKNDETYIFKVISIPGQTVLVTGKKTINIQHLPAGEYFLSVSGSKSGTIGTKKFIVR